MGAQQSTGGDGAGAGAGGAVEVKTSYYELLGVERTATDEEIKKAYRRKALELHPDRNYGDSERTTALFADVQSAYEVLSDPQERAWYDAHEGDILRGGEGGDKHYEYNMESTTADDIARMMGKFRGKVDYSDSPNGFFGFLRETFEKLAREEERAGDFEDVSVPDFPSFGHKDDTHEDVVRNFYSVWNGFSTVKTFAFLDVYNPASAPDRRVRRLMEKENKKFREEGIRQYNDAVRTLVAFVRKRDPRYQPDTRSVEEAAKAQREARKAQAARARAAHAEKFNLQQDAIPEWAKARDPDELEEETEEEIEEEHYECVACRKTFKSERQFDAHEKSKKHQKAVQSLKRQMRKDNAHLHLDEDVTSSGVITPASGDDDDVGDATASERGTPDESIDDLAEDLKTVQVEDESTDSDSPRALAPDSQPEAATQRKPQPSTANASSEEDSDDDDDEYASRSDIEARLAGFRETTDTPDTDTLPPDPPDTDSATPAEKKLGKAAQKRAKKAAKQAEIDESELKHKCVSCSKAFPSKTRLFQHLQDFPKHAAPVSVTKGAGGGGKKGKGKKK